MNLINIETGYVTETKEGIICRALVENSDGKKATMLGTGSTLEVASQAAISNSKAQLAMLSGTNEPQSTYYQGQSTNNQRNNNPMDDKSKFNGGGSKPASDKQINWIENSARKNGGSGDALAQEKFGKYIHQLTGSEAHELIGELKFPKPF